MGLDALFDRILNHLAFRMDCEDVPEALKKLMSLELTTNPDAQDLDYIDLMHVVILKLVEFYQDSELEELWHNYLNELSEETNLAA